MKVYFIKNEVGKREAQPTGQEEIDVSKKSIGLIIVGHIGHSQAEIVELLNRKAENITAEVVVFQTELPNQQGSLEVLVQERGEQLLISIEKSCKEMSAMLFEEKIKPQHPNIYYTPKVQKTQLPTRKNYVSRKK